MDAQSKKKVVETAQKIIFVQEGNYGSVNANDNGAVSVGKVQWHAGRALAILKNICKAESRAASILGDALYKEIMTAQSWNTRTVTPAEKTAISALLVTPAGKAEQDRQAEIDVGAYVDHGLQMGIEDPAALVYFADLENQGGAGASKRVAEAAVKPVTLDTIHAAALSDRVMGKYSTRRKNVYEAAKTLKTATQKPAEPQKMSEKEKQLRNDVKAIMEGWVGATKGSAKHLEILRIYNGHKPLARGYEVKPADAYCATTVSAAYIKAGIAGYTGTECGVEEFTKIAKQKGIWIEDDAHSPLIGDACAYDWQDNGKGDNTGYADHIGIVTEVSGTSFVVTEGNMNGGRVGTRQMQVNGQYIRGFICPDFAAIAASGAVTGEGSRPTAEPEPGEIIYTVQWKDTLSGIARKYGTTYQALAAYNGIQNPNVIKVGQIIKIPAKGATETTQKPAEITYTVQWKDTLSGIARKYGTTYQALAKYNNIQNPNVIRVGQTIRIPQ